MSDEQRYTLEEARIIFKTEACNTYGHNYEVVPKRLENRPVRIFCARCDKKWNVENPNDERTQLIPKVDDSTQVLPRVHQ